MKKFKKMMLSVLCVGVILGTTACGTNNGTGDNAANDTTTQQNDAGNTDKTDNVGGTSNGATDTNNGADTNNGGVVDDIGNAVGDGINDVGDGVKNITDDVTGNDGNYMTNDATNGTADNNR